MRIVVPDDNPPALAGTPALDRLRKIDEVQLYDSDATDPAVLAERLRDADVAVNIRGRTRFTDQVLQACTELKLISIWGTGTDNVDLKAAAASGITVTNTPGANPLAVAEHTVALIVAVTKQLAQADRAMRQGGWPPNLVPQLRGKRLLIGTGLIGREVESMGRGLGLEVVAWTFHPNPTLAVSLGLRYVDLDELLQKTVDLIRTRFSFYHASVFLKDLPGEFVVIREATGEAGAQLKRAGHKLAIGSKSVVGFVAGEGKPLIVNDTTRDVNYFANPLLPYTRSEAAIPLKAAA